MIDETLRVLPHDLEAERAILGGLIINNAGLDVVLTTVGAADFFRRAHSAIFRAITTIVLDQKSAVDLVMLKDELTRMGEFEECGGAAYISSITDGVPKSANVGYYARIIREKALLRRAIATANKILLDAYDEQATATDVIRDADREILQLQKGALTGRMRNLRESAGDIYGILEYHEQHKGELLGVDTGFASLNEVTFGWEAGDLVIVAARPSIGKTAWLLHTLIAASRAGKKAVVFSLEMRRRQLEYRVLASLSGVALQRIRSGYLGEADFEAISRATGEMADLDIEIDDTASLTAWDVRAACRRLKADRGLDLVAIDYVQLMRGSLDRKGANRTEEVTDISRRIKVLADELQVPILLLSQLSRDSEHRADKRPKLSDLRESGALEQDADLVCFLHRKHHRESGTTQFIIEKQRNGPGGTVNLTFTRETQQFADGGDEPPAEAPAEEPKKRKPRY